MYVCILYKILKIYNLLFLRKYTEQNTAVYLKRE